MASSKFYSLGSDLQLISDSATWAEYLKLHPDAKVGFVHHGRRCYLTLILPSLGHRGIVRYADTAEGLIELAHLALIEENGIEVL